MKIGDILVRNGDLSPEQVEALLRDQASRPGKRLGELAVEREWLPDSTVLKALAEQFHLDFMETVDPEHFDEALIRTLSVDWARSHQMLPIRVDGTVSAAIANTDELSALDHLSLLVGCEVTPILVPAREVQKAIDACYMSRTDRAGQPDEPESVEIETDPRLSDTNDLLRTIDSAPVSQLVNSILLDAVRKGASDVHIEPFDRHLRIRFRVDGYLYDQPAPPKRLEAALTSRLKVMGHLDIAERRLPQDGMTRVRVGESEIDIRISTVPVAEGERVVLRLLNQGSSLMPLEDLGMPQGMLPRLREQIRMPHGMILVTGPTGSGKTTTLYSVLGELDTAHQNIMTIEDPIEYQMADIGQIQVKPKIGLTFAGGLRHILRQDPDIIFVGEIRDRETADIAVRSALTGHLVLSTLHTNDARSAVVRMLDMGIEPYLLASALRCSMGQRLVRVLCPHCARPLTAEEVSSLPDAMQSRAREEGWKTPAGCEQCMGGFRGRTGIYELLEISDGVESLIRDPHRVAEALKEHEASIGFRSMFDDGLDKCRQGVTSPGEVLRVAGDRGLHRT